MNFSLAMENIKKIDCFRIGWAILKTKCQRQTQTPDLSPTPPKEGSRSNLESVSISDVAWCGATEMGPVGEQFTKDSSKNICHLVLGNTPD